MKTAVGSMLANGLRVNRVVPRSGRAARSVDLAQVRTSAGAGGAAGSNSRQLPCCGDPARDAGRLGQQPGKQRAGAGPPSWALQPK